MGNNKFYTPDGFQDTLPGICAFKKDAESKLRRLFSLHGYSEIETPGVEYCDIYTKPSFVKEEELYKMVDQKGRLLCSRYDGTIPAARFAATLYKDEPLPLRLCYIENMYRFSKVGGGKQSEFTQAGIELMGACGSDADSEVIAMAIKSALEIGVTDLQISIGQVKLFTGIARQFGLDGDSSSKLRKAITDRDYVMIEKTAKDAGLDAEGIKTIMMLADGNGTFDLLDEFEKRVTDAEALEAIVNLREILEAIDEYDYLKYVSIDLGLFGNEDYYTGMIFKGFTYEVGFPIIGGGRYDNTVGVFGREMACVGFSISLSLSITALMRQGKIDDAKGIDVIIGYDKSIKGTRAAALAMAEQMREEGSIVIVDSSNMTEEELDSYAESMKITACFYISETSDEE